MAKIKIELHPDAKADLKNLMMFNSLVVTRITATLQQLSNDPALALKIAQHGYRNTDTDRIDVKKWLRLKSLGLWRLKITDLEASSTRYRIIYALSSDLKIVSILAVAARGEINYDDPNDPLTHRILRARDSLLQPSGHGAAEAPVAVSGARVHTLSVGRVSRRS